MNIDEELILDTDTFRKRIKSLNVLRTMREKSGTLKKRKIIYTDKTIKYWEHNKTRSNEVINSARSTVGRNRKTAWIPVFCRSLDVVPTVVPPTTKDFYVFLYLRIQVRVSSYTFLCNKLINNLLLLLLRMLKINKYFGPILEKLQVPLAIGTGSERHLLKPANWKVKHTQNLKER